MNDLASKIGISTQHIWQVAVRQATIDSWTQIVQLILAFTLLAFFVIVIGFAVKNQDQNKLSDDKAAILGLGSLIGALGTVIFLSFYVPPTLNSIVTGFVNPESKALDKLVSQIKEVK